MLRAENLSYRINSHFLVRDVTLSLDAGEVFALTGPNGAGKSTLLRLLSGELPPTAGVVYLDDKPLNNYKPRELALKRAVMAQRALINFAFTVEEVVMLGRHPHIQRAETERDHQIVAEALQKTESSHLSDRIYPTLSGGEQSRVTLARVLAQETQLLLLDEPTSALDLRHQQVVMVVARELAARGMSVLAIVHDLNLAATYADRIGIMHHGYLEAVGTPDEVLTESIITSVFNVPVRVIPHPDLNCPLVLPLAPNGSK
jgi:iron complex transport system ATP-binding protein